MRESLGELEEFDGEAAQDLGGAHAGSRPRREEKRTSEEQKPKPPGQDTVEAGRDGGRERNGKRTKWKREEERKETGRKWGQEIKRNNLRWKNECFGWEEDEVKWLTSQTGGGTVCSGRVSGGRQSFGGWRGVWWEWPQGEREKRGGGGGLGRQANADKEIFQETPKKNTRRIRCNDGDALKERPDPRRARRRRGGRRCAGGDEVVAVVVVVVVVGTWYWWL